MSNRISEIDRQRAALRGDKPQVSIANDRFGFREIAEAIATALREGIESDGYTIGLEGPWGSGKTTLLNFVGEAFLERATPQQRVVRFEPWLIGHRDVLLTEFFCQIADVIENFRNDATVANKIGQGKDEIFTRLARNLRLYPQLVQFGGDALSGAAMFDPSPFGRIASVIIKLLQNVLIWWAKRLEPTLEGTKKSIVDDLQVLGNLVHGARIVVLIDDTDRLDTSETFELLRLIKAIANFPMVAYVICFDRGILAERVKAAINGDGNSYLDKFFQQVISIPPQEPFALRRFVKSELANVFPGEKLAAVLDANVSERENTVFDVWMGRLVQTPRDAIRLCDSIAFGWPHLRGRGDFLDFCWLQLVKLRDAELYGWVQRYVTNLASYRDNGRPGDEEAAEMGVHLKLILTRLGWKGIPDRSNIVSILPGLRKALWAEKGNSVFEFEGPDELPSFEATKRLGSPSHWRYYFAFDKPSYALSDEDIEAVLQAAQNDPMHAAELLTSIAGRPHPATGHYLSTLLSRLADRKEQFSSDTQIGLAKALAEMMDSVSRGRMHNFDGVDPWAQAARLLGQAVSPLFAGLVADAPSICWIAYVIRNQGFALGYGPARDAQPERQWMQESDYARAVAEAINRFKQLGLEGIIMTQEPLEILFCWRQFGDAKEIRDLITLETQNDDAFFVRFLNAIVTFVNSSDRGLYQILYKEIVDLFMDVEITKARLDRLASREGAFKEAATGLVSKWETHIFK